jgi:hypothetical protein
MLYGMLWAWLNLTLNRLILWHDNCLLKLVNRQQRLNDMKNARETVNSASLSTFDNLTEQDIILLWQSFKSAGLSGDEAWNAIMTGMALDMAFSRTQKLSRIEH